VKCRDCGTEAAEVIGLCRACIERASAEELLAPHTVVRRALGLPTAPPQDGAPCRLCANACRIPEGKLGYCGLRTARGGRARYLWPEGARAALAHIYYDPLPTNCCAAWFCGEEEGKNLAVFFYGCNFDCLFCQNAQHKFLDEAEALPEEELVRRALAPGVRCVCFFGGSPEPQLPFALRGARRIVEEAEAQGREIHICWEWNGAGSPTLVRQAAELSLASRGIVKFDLKAWDEKLALALCGVSTRPSFDNFRMVAEELLPAAGHPLLTATTLLVPGYVGEEEVRKIAGFIATLSPDIPYSLLLFHPAYCLSDLSVTPLEQALGCFRAAREAGLRRVHVGNLHLLGLSFPAFLSLANKHR